MAIYATYTDGATIIENAYIKIDRIWMSKSEGLNAWVYLYKNKGSTDVLSTFSVHCEYDSSAVNPYVDLYDALSKLAFLSNVTSSLVEQVETVEHQQVRGAEVAKSSSKKKKTK